MRKRVRYFDLHKIARNDEPLSPSEQEVSRRLSCNPEPSLVLRLDLQAAFGKLPTRQRQAIELFAQGHNECEIARAMGVSQPAVYKLLEKARASLKKFLGRGL